MPMVTVIVPVFNGGERVYEAVGSVLAQTESDFEVLLVADGGADELAWADTIDRRVRVHRQINAGVSSARNTGASLTTAPLIAFLDQDDRWLPEKLEQQLAGLTEECSWSTTDFSWCLPSRPPVAGRHRALTRTDLLSGGHFCLSSLLVRREAFEVAGGFDTRLAIVQDYELALRLCDVGPAAHCPEVLVEYRVHDRNASRDHRRGYQERTSIMRGAPRNEDERAAARLGLADSRRLYGHQAWAAFARERKPGDAARAVLWSPGVVLRGLLAAFRNRLPGRLTSSTPPYR